MTDALRDTMEFVCQSPPIWAEMTKQGHTEHCYIAGCKDACSTTHTYTHMGTHTSSTHIPPLPVNIPVLEPSKLLTSRSRALIASLDELISRRKKSKKNWLRDFSQDKGFWRHGMVLGGMSGTCSTILQRASVFSKGDLWGLPFLPLTT